jgi:hypothetical protein
LGAQAHLETFGLASASSFKRRTVRREHCVLAGWRLEAEGSSRRSMPASPSRGTRAPLKRDALLRSEQIRDVIVPANAFNSDVRAFVQAFI